jgi:hypothetical protein
VKKLKFIVCSLLIISLAACSAPADVDADVRRDNTSAEDAVTESNEETYGDTEYDYEDYENYDEYEEYDEYIDEYVDYEEESEFALYEADSYDPAEQKENIIPFKILTGNYSGSNHKELGDMNYWVYLTDDNKLYSGSSPYEDHYVDSPVLLAEDVRYLDSAYFDSYLYYIKNDNSVWAFGTNAEEELGPKIEGTDANGETVLLDYYPPENAIKIFDNAANVVLSDDAPNGIAGIISTDKVYYAHTEEFEFTKTPLENVVQVDGTNSRVLFATGDLCSFYSNTLEISEYNILAKNIAEYFFGTYTSCYAKTIDDKLITITDVGHDITLWTEDVKDLLFDASFERLEYYDHHFVIKNDGSFWGMGGNSIGQLGDGTFEERDEFIKIADDVIYGIQFAYITSDGTLYRWSESDPTPTPFPDVKFKYLAYDYYDYPILIDTEGSLWGMYTDDGKVYKKEAQPGVPYTNLIIPGEVIL